MTIVKAVLKVVMGVGFIAAGVNHFLSTTSYVRIMPSYLPWHTQLVLISGVAEVALGILLLVRRTSTMAAWGLIALLLAVFPANVQMAMHAELFPQIPAAVLWIRLPLQAALIAWAYWYTRRSPADLLQ